MVTFGIVGTIVAALGLWAVKTMYSSSAALSYIVGPAWDTADGAMETSIKIEAQMLAVKRLILGADSQAVEATLRSAIEDVNDASSRMIQAGLLSSAQSQQFSQFNTQYQQSRDGAVFPVTKPTLQRRRLMTKPPQFL
ncbi:methyl-accepting chemotaxis protein [Vibrio mimicus VM573]|nr:methyl-accepting chemotaxis protein [Vibrio mimicus VM573]